MAFNVFAMPSSTIFLLFTFVFGGSNAMPWNEAQQTHVYQADPWSPRPTTLPTDPARLFKRDSLDVAICGWLGGNSAKAATCSAGSSCIRDTIHWVVGCCATSGPCTAGVYTSCIDQNSNNWTPNSGLQNNGVYTCSGTSVCYKNSYAGGYFQYGCGESSWATTVETTYSGMPSDLLLQQVFTGVNFTPTTSTTSTSSTSSSSSTTSTTTTSSSTSSKTTSSRSSTLPTASKVPTQTGTSTPTSTAVSKKKNDTGMIIGAVIGGLAGLAIIGAALFWFLRKKQAQNKQRRAGPFESVHNNGPSPTAGPFQRMAPYQPFGPDDFGHSTQIVGGGAFPTPYSYSDAPGPSTPPMNSSADVHHQFYASPPIGYTREAEPLVSEIDDFAMNYHNAIGASVPVERDTQIHTGDMPDIALGAVTTPLRRTPTSAGGIGRTQDIALTSEAFRPPPSATIPTDNDWAPSGLRPSPSFSRDNGESSTSLLNRSTSSAAPPRSPLRESMAGMGATLGSAVSAVVGRDNAPRYQLVDEARDGVPVLSSPGQLRQARMSKGVKWEDSLQ